MNVICYQTSLGALTHLPALAAVILRLSMILTCNLEQP